MPTLGAPATALQDDLVLPIPGKDGTIREYRIPPCTAEGLFDIVALHGVWSAMGKLHLGQAAPTDLATAITADASLQHRIQHLVDGGLSTEQILALSLGPVSDQMLADGVGKTHYILASMTAMYWHLAGDEAARQVWTLGRPVSR